MKKLIRNRKTRAFLTCSGHWTSDIIKARCFQASEDAWVICQDLKLHNCELYYSFSKRTVSEYDFVVAIN
jgi:hypothetical protein